MSTQADPHAPGNPASGIAQGAMAALGLGGGGAGPGLGFGSGSGSGDVSQASGFDSSAFNVNFGDGVMQGGGSGILLLAVVIAGVILWSR